MRRIRLPALIALVAATIPGFASAQRIEHSGVSMRRLRDEVTTPVHESVLMEAPGSPGPKRGLFAGGVVGGVVGIITGYTLGLALRSAETKRRCDRAFATEDKLSCLDHLMYAAYGEVIGIPVGVYAANKGRGRLPLMILGSTGVALLGVFSSIIAPPVLLAIPPAQILFSMRIASGG